MNMISPVYKGPERRKGVDRRQLADKRSGIRFDDNGGDRREGMGRRESDLNLEFIS